jgi:hypothetical protein
MQFLSQWTQPNPVRILMRIRSKNTDSNAVGSLYTFSPTLTQRFYTANMQLVGGGDIECQHSGYSDELFDGWWIGKDLEGTGFSISRYYPGIRVEWLMKATSNFNQGSLCPGRDSNRVPPEYKSVLLPLNQPTWAMYDFNYSSCSVHGG